jgi:hypothetical protein
MKQKEKHPKKHKKIITKEIHSKKQPKKKKGEKTKRDTPGKNTQPQKAIQVSVGTQRTRKK